MLAVYVSVLMAVGLAQLNVLSQVVLTVGLLVHGCIYGYRSLSNHIKGVRYHHNGWQLSWAGRWYKAWPDGLALVNGRFMSLPFKVDNGQTLVMRRVLIFPDSADERQLHALRLRVLLGGFKANGVKRRLWNIEQ